MSITATVRGDTATPAINRLLDAASPSRAAAVVGPRIERLFQRHFRALPPNKKGWLTTFFWMRAANATRWAPHGDGVRITVSQPGVRQRLLGGFIKAREKLLTIPADPETYGTPATEYGFLKFVPIHGLKTFGALVQKTDTPILHHSVSIHTMRVMFWLLDWVYQRGDKHVLPAREEIQREATAALQEEIQRTINHR